MAEMLLPKNQALRITRYEYRLIFEKKGRARYISHLDLMRAFQRVFKRAGLPLWYTQGFNPHAYLMFPLALSLGIDSSVEPLDIALTEELSFDEIRQRINEKMPEGLSIVSVGKPVMKHTEIKSAEYIVRLMTDLSPEQTADAFKCFLERDKIEVEKRSKKKGINLVDIKPHIGLIYCRADDKCTEISLRLPAGTEFNLNTNVVFDAFEGFFEGTILSVYTTRTKILSASGENFI